MHQTGLTQIYIIIVILIVVALSGGAYYLGIGKEVQKQNITAPSPSSKTEFTEKDGVVWVAVSNIVLYVNLYYSETKKLPKNFEEINSLPSLSSFKVEVNPFTNKPYNYTPYPDGKGFSVSGMQSNGTDYKKEISFD